MTLLSKIIKVGKILWKYGAILATGYEVKEIISGIGSTEKTDMIEKSTEEAVKNMAIEKSVRKLQEMLEEENVDKNEFVMITVMFGILFLILALILFKVCIAVGKCSMKKFKRSIQQ